MALVIAVTGLFVYRRVANELRRTVDQTLMGQSREEIHRGNVDADTGSGPTLAQLFGPRGQLLHSQPPGAAPLVGREPLAEAAAGRQVWLDTRLPAQNDEWRVAVRPAASRRGGAALV